MKKKSVLFAAHCKSSASSYLSQVCFGIPFDLVVHTCSTMNFRRLICFVFKDVTTSYPGESGLSECC